MALSINSKNKKIRVGGSGYTVFQWDGQVIGWAQNVNVDSPRPVADPVPIHPLDSRYPLQIITPAAIGPGTLTVTYWEKYNEKVWDDIMSVVTGSSTQKFNDLVQIFIQLAAANSPVTCLRVVQPPVLRGQSSKIYADVYHNCVITDVRDNEQIQVATMDIAKPMTIAYTHMTRYGPNYGSNILPSGISGVDSSGLPAIGVQDPNFF